MDYQYVDKGIDQNNPNTHILIEVGGVLYSVPADLAQETANEIAHNRGLI